MKKNQKSKSTLKLFYKNFKKISKLPLTERKKALAQANGHPLIFKSLREIAKNVLNRNVKFKNADLVDILDEKIVDYLKKISNRKNSTKSCSCKLRRKYIQEGAGHLSILIPAIAPNEPFFMK